MQMRSLTSNYEVVGALPSLVMNIFVCEGTFRDLGTLVEFSE